LKLKSKAERQYNSIVKLEGIFFVSCTTKDEQRSGIESLREGIVSLAESMDVLNFQIPGFYKVNSFKVGDFCPIENSQLNPPPQSVVDKFKEVRTKAPFRFMRILAFQRAFCPEGLNEASITTMLSFLDDAGVVIWFNRIISVRDLVILDPQLLADLFSSLVSFKVNWKNGIVTRSELEGAWKSKGVPTEIYGMCIQILKAFEILFPHQTKGPASAYPANWTTS